MSTTLHQDQRRCIPNSSMQFNPEAVFLHLTTMQLQITFVEKRHVKKFAREKGFLPFTRSISIDGNTAATAIKRRTSFMFLW